MLDDEYELKIKNIHNYRDEAKSSIGSKGSRGSTEN